MVRHRLRLASIIMKRRRITRKLKMERMQKCQIKVVELNIDSSEDYIEAPLLDSDHQIGIGRVER